MKLISAALLLATSVLATSANALTESERRYSRFLEVDQITPRDIVAYKTDPDDMNSETAFCMTVGMGQGTTKCLPKGGSSGERKLQIHRPNRVRRTEDLIITRPSAETGLFFSREIVVEIENVDIATSPTVVFTGINGNDHVYSFPVEDVDDIGEGVAVQILGGLQVGDYTMSLVAADGSELIAMPEGDVITVGPEIVKTTDGDAKVAEDHYDLGGDVAEAAGRIYFQVKGKWFGCSGSVIRDGKTGRSLILTAAHCVFDDDEDMWAFSYNAIFIPNRNAVDIPDGETGANIHLTCTADVCGCWSLSGGVVHDKWPDTAWPHRLIYDYGFYVVNDYGMHEGEVCNNSTALDVAVIDDLQFAVAEGGADGRDILGQFAYGFGYSLTYNPFFRYCADTIILENWTLWGSETAWIPACKLSGGASGGPWMLGFDEVTGSGKLVSVNSWSKTYADGNGGPFVDEVEGRCLVEAARNVDMAMLEAAAHGDAGIFANCYDLPCVTADEAGAARKLREGRELCGSNHRLYQTAAQRRREQNN